MTYRGHRTPMRGLGLTLGVALMACPGAAWAQQDGFVNAHHPTRLLIGLRAGADEHDVARAMAVAGVHQQRDLGRCRVVACNPGGLPLRATAAVLAAQPGIAYCEPDYVIRGNLTPNDPELVNQYGLALIGAETAWDSTTGSSQVVIGMTDSGIDLSHADLAANLWVNPGEIPGNGVDDDANGYVDDVNGWDFRNDDNDPFDDWGHGTHVAGTAGAVGNNGLDGVGVCWNVRMAALKFLNDTGLGFTSDAVEAVQYANTMGFPIVNASWGGGSFSTPLRDAIAAGGLFVASAGNDGEDVDLTPHYPSSYDLPNVIAVASIDAMEDLAFTSNFGAVGVDLAAPGVQILSTVLGGGTGVLSGTSMAAPHVSGAAALLLAQRPELDAIALRQLILASVAPVPGLNGAVATGGRLDLAAAMALANAPATLEWDLDEYEVVEGDGVVALTVVRTGSLVGAVSVDYFTFDIDTQGGADYTPSFGTLSFADGEASQVLLIPLVDDGAIEGEEVFIAGLENPGGGAQIGAQFLTAVVIADDDTGGGGDVTFRWAAAEYELVEDTGSVVVTILREGDLTGSATVEYFTFDIDATAGVDYTPAFGTHTFGPLETSFDLTLSITADQLDEGFEEIFVIGMETTTPNATVAQPEAVGVVILDDD